MNTPGQKLKILKIYNILLEKTDEEHPLLAPDIIKLLEAEGISAERKTIYKDIQDLMAAGLDVEKNEAGYYVASRTFQMPELKLLVDAVSASKFISEKKSRELIKKIATLTSTQRASQLSRQLIVPDKVKTDNEKIFYTIDEIYQCIEENKRMSFQYEDWTVDKKKSLRHNGKRYMVSPAFLIRNDENYYLVAFDHDSSLIKHYRVDKILGATMENLPRGGINERNALVPEEYAKAHVSMFSGITKTITLKASTSKVGILLDKFGTDISIRDMKDGTIQARVEIAVSPQLYGWLTGVGIVISAPSSEVDCFREYLQKQIDAM